MAQPGTGNDPRQAKKTTDAQGEQPSTDPQLRKIHETANSGEEFGRGGDRDPIEGGSRHDTQ
jgi:hypothetical protein